MTTLCLTALLEERMNMPYSQRSNMPVTVSFHPMLPGYLALIMFERSTSSYSPPTNLLDLCHIPADFTPVDFSYFLDIWHLITSFLLQEESCRGEFSDSLHSLPKQERYQAHDANQCPACNAGICHL
jgi:hypothetical protein